MHILSKYLSLFAAAAFWVPSAGAADAFFDSEHFSGSGNCGICHNNLFDANSNDVSVESEWSATMMANAARDPLWRAKFASELIRNPALTDVLNNKCTRCHAPMANEESSYFPGDTEFFGAGFANPSNLYHDAAMDGVSCTLCHQIADTAALGTPDGASGHFVIEEFANPFDRPAFGQYSNPRVNPMRNNAVFTPRHSAHVSDSAICATCHNLMTPVLDSRGEVIPGAEFPEQVVYTEWENSTFADGRSEASTCQECHMARANGVRIANRPRNLPRRNNFARHGFYGGNTLMLDILGANRNALDVADGDFAAAIDATRATLKSAADLVIEEATISAGELLVRVRITNNTGHKIPTSYPSRRIYVHLTVADPAGNMLFESGRLNKATGRVVGVKADSGSGYERHFASEITNPYQVQVYEAIMGDSDGNQTYTLLRASKYLKDNRIPPRGFPMRSAPAEVAVIGVGNDPDFVAGSDRVTYRVRLPAGTARVVVNAELNYQTLAYGYLLDLKQDAADPAVKRFLDLYDASSVRVETIASDGIRAWASGI